MESFSLHQGSPDTSDAASAADAATKQAFDDALAAAERVNAHYQMQRTADSIASPG
jgi:hypothetical protein